MEWIAILVIIVVLSFTVAELGNDIKTLRGRIDMLERKMREDK